MLAIIIVPCEGPVQACLGAMDCQQKSDGHQLWLCAQRKVEKEFSGFCGISTTTKSFLSHDYMQNTVQGPVGHLKEENNHLAGSLHQ